LRVAGLRRRNYKNVQVAPTQNKLGCPPAALKRSYSPRTANEPKLNCAPLPAAKLTFVLLTGAGVAMAGQAIVGY
jgi:hypothetical protein